MGPVPPEHTQNPERSVNGDLPFYGINDCSGSNSDLLRASRTSELPSIADIERTFANGSFVPEPDSCTAAKISRSRSHPAALPYRPGSREPCGAAESDYMA
jgi:hypothetical protein